MVSPRKTWAEKMDNGHEPEVKPIDADWAGMKKGDLMLISTPLEIRDYVKRIPAGEHREINQMRLDLAHKHEADGMCPMTAAMFLRIVAEEAIDELNSGKKPEEITPFWRLVSPNDKIFKKISASFLPPFTPDFVAKMRTFESSTLK